MEEDRVTVRNFINSKDFIVLNKTLIKILGLKETLFLQFLIVIEDLFLQEGMDEIFCKQETVEKQILLSPYEQRQCIKKLKSLGILEITKKGFPATYYFRINYTNLKNLLCSDKKTSSLMW
jgi:hypothetical protein